MYSRGVGVLRQTRAIYIYNTPYPTYRVGEKWIPKEESSVIIVVMLMRLTKKTCLDVLYAEVICFMFNMKYSTILQNVSEIILG